MRRLYPFDLIEAKWQQVWQDSGAGRAADPGEPGSDKPKFLVMDMFPYPSGSGLHVGHPLGYTATDIIARYKRARSFNVLHPMGWDAFGLPAEQYAIQTGTHPAVTTKKNIQTFKRQLIQLGFLYDWSREVDTTDPKYFRWTQWIFLQLYKRGLAYVAEIPVWYCESLGTVLANEEVLNTEDGPRSERGNHPVSRVPLRQWMLKITAYADRLIDDLEKVDWPENLKEMQRNWIGRSEGAEVDFGVQNSEAKIKVFTTRPDTLFGATYMVLAPEHALVDSLTPAQWPANTPDDWKGPRAGASPRDAVAAYRKWAASRSDLERTDLAKEKTGVFTGAYAINPVNQERVPIWIADYVLATYGTGAIMAVPAHDERDWAFARKYAIEIRRVVQDPAGENAGVFTGEGAAVNSPPINGLPTPKAKKKITEWLEERGLGKRSVQYKLRDWLFSRQRYWGEPFPIVWRGDRHEPLPEEQLPLTLPEMESFHHKPSSPGEPMLAAAAEWVNLPGGARREVNTMPQWAGSCWYYLRYLDPKNDQALVDPKKEKYWMNVDLYVGGAEHAVLHLLYSRFWHKVLFDIGVVSTPEPFQKLVNQGMVLGEDHQKMSKSRGNVISSDSVVTQYGGDSLRLYEMFMGPLEQMKPWSTQGVEGVYRFLGRVWRMFADESSQQELEDLATAHGGATPEALAKVKLSQSIVERPATPEELRALHKTIKKVTSDLEAMSFNTAISEMMVFTNEAAKWQTRPLAAMKTFLQLLAPFAPHLAEELWSKTPEGAKGAQGTILNAGWPTHDEAYLFESEIEYVVQVNGKVRDRVKLPAEADQPSLEKAALASEKIQKLLEGRVPKKWIVVPKKLVNIVV